MCDSSWGDPMRLMGLERNKPSLRGLAKNPLDYHDFLYDCVLVMTVMICLLHFFFLAHLPAYFTSKIASHYELFLKNRFGYCLCGLLYGLIERFIHNHLHKKKSSVQGVDERRCSVYYV